jgi:hypothetical protein
VSYEEFKDYVFDFTPVKFFLPDSGPHNPNKILFLLFPFQLSSFCFALWEDDS